MKWESFAVYQLKRARVSMGVRNPSMASDQRLSSQLNPKGNLMPRRNKKLVGGEGFTCGMMKEFNWKNLAPVTPSFYLLCTWVPEAKHEWEKHRTLLTDLLIFIMTPSFKRALMVLGNQTIFPYTICSPRSLKNCFTMCPFSLFIYYLSPTCLSWRCYFPFHWGNRSHQKRRTSILYLSDLCLCPTHSCFSSSWLDVKLGPLSTRWLHPFLDTYRHCFRICLLSFLYHLISPVSARPFPTNIQTCCNFLQWISWTRITFRHRLVLLFVCLLLCLLQNFSKISYAVHFHFVFYQFRKTLCFFSGHN